MAYSLKSTVLSEVDLSGTHVTGAWITQPRIRHGANGGRWTKGGGGPVPGAHARYKDPGRDLADSFHGVTVEDAASFAEVDFDGLLHKAADPSAPETEREMAVRKVNLHIEQMRRIVQQHDPTTGQRRTTVVTTTRGKVALGPEIKRPVQPEFQLKQEALGKIAKEKAPVKTYAKEATTDAARVAMTQQVLGYAVRAAGAAAALIGAHESEAMVEQLHHLSENLAVESGVNVALTLLLTLLIGKIQKAFRDRHDRRVAKARGEIQ